MPRPIRKLPTPKPIAKTAEAFATVLYDLDTVLDAMARWPAVRTDVLAWAESCLSHNCGWCEYRLAQLILAEMSTRDRR